MCKQYVGHKKSCLIYITGLLIALTPLSSVLATVSSKGVMQYENAAFKRLRSACVSDEHRNYKFDCNANRAHYISACGFALRDISNSSSSRINTKCSVCFATAQILAPEASTTCKYIVDRYLCGNGPLILAHLAVRNCATHANKTSTYWQSMYNSVKKNTYLSRDIILRKYDVEFFSLLTMFDEQWLRLLSVNSALNKCQEEAILQCPIVIRSVHSHVAGSLNSNRV